MGRRGALSRLSETEALLLLRILPGLGDRTTFILIGRWGSARAALGTPDALEKVAGPGPARAARDPGLLGRARALHDTCGRLGIEVVGVSEPAYPARLRDLHDPPAVLFLRGRRELLDRPMVAVVGARRATAAGRRVAERLGRGLSRAGVTVVSGLALGVDGAAHRGALDGEGGTAAVLGRGPDRAYPVSHGALFRRIAREGLLVSEFPPGEGVRPHHFPRRNRILAALAAGVVVVEAGPGSGALLTVDHALDIGRHVMAVPGSVEVTQSQGTNRLLREGAALVTGSRDVLEVLTWPGAGREAERPGSAGVDPVLQLALPAAVLDGMAGPPGVRELGRLEALLGPRPLPLEEVLERSGLPPGRALATLSLLEIHGRARREPDGWILEEA